MEMIEVIHTSVVSGVSKFISRTSPKRAAARTWLSA